MVIPTSWTRRGWKSYLWPATSFVPDGTGSSTSLSRGQDFLLTFPFLCSGFDGWSYDVHGNSRPVCLSCYTSRVAVAHRFFPLRSPSLKDSSTLVSQQVGNQHLALPSRPSAGFLHPVRRTSSVASFQLLTPLSFRSLVAFTRQVVVAFPARMETT